MQHRALQAKYCKREIAAVRGTGRISEMLIYMIAQICIHKMHLKKRGREKNLISREVCCLQRQRCLCPFEHMKRGITGYQSVVIPIHVRLSPPLILVPDESSHLLRLSSCLVRYV